MELIQKPVPHPTPLSKPYWDAAAEGRMVLQQCGACGKIRHYPRLICDACYSDEVTWHEATRRGRVHSWTVAHHAFHAAFKDELPYVLVTVDLEEGVRSLGRWLGGALTIGLAVQGRFVTEAGRADLVFEPLQP